MPLRLPLAIGVLALCFAATAHATQVVLVDTPDLVRSSSDIVVGRVESVHSHWNDAHTRIVTDVVVSVSEALKGGAGGSLTLVQMGGEVDGMKLSVDGSPRFHIGEESVLFVWRDAKGKAQVNGLAQGKFAIQRDAATGKAYVSRSLAGLSFVGDKSIGEGAATGAEARVPLEEFKRLVRREVASPSRSGRE